MQYDTDSDGEDVAQIEAQEKKKRTNFIRSQLKKRRRNVNKSDLD